MKYALGCLLGLVSFNVGLIPAAHAALADGAVKNDAVASEKSIGQLDLTPETQTFFEFVGVNDPEDSYHFFLEAPNQVTLELGGLTQGANLLLTDASGNLITKSTNPGTQAELITADLEPGNYVIVVRSTLDNNTTYRLTAGAQFITDEIPISFEQADITDPEFDSSESRVTWQDKDSNLWVAPVNPSGEFDLAQAEIITTGLAPIPAPDGTGNGPEWGSTGQGVGILYTALVNGNFFLGLAEFVNGQWVTEILPGGKFGHSPFGTLIPNDPQPLVAYFVGTPAERRRAIAWGPLAAPNQGGLVPYTRDDQGNVEGIRWVEGARSLVYTLPIDNKVKQVVRYDVTTGRLTQLTFTQNQKGAAFMWQAPEYGGELLLMTKETESISSRVFNRVGIYRNINGQWTRIKLIKPPSDLAEIRSPEPFTYQGKSYISMLLENDKREPSEVWIGGIDPAVDFYRQVSDPELALVRNDPEAFETEEGVFVYYAVRGKGVIVRAATGL